MRFSSFVSFAFAGLAACSTWSFDVNEEYLAAENALKAFEARHPESIKAALDTMDAGSLTKFLNDFNKGLQNVDTVVAGITKANVASQMDKFVASGKQLNSIAVKHAPTIKSTGPVSLSGAIGLLTPGMNFVRTVNSTFRHITEKRQIILDAHLEGKVKDALLGGKEGILSMVDALPTQLPKELTSTIESVIGTKLPPLPTAETMRPMIEGAIDFIYQVCATLSLTHRPFETKMGP
jgi:hypothetical protein